jgi:beta-lactam-binding protein with PASTA domain
MTEAEAIKALKDNGFEVTVRYILNTDSKPEGTVKDCTPAAGEKVSFGSKVSISVWGDDLMVTTTT